MTIEKIKEFQEQVAVGMPNNPAIFGWASYSQCDEDGIIRECLRRISLKAGLSKTFFEIGCSDGLENNTHQLILDGYSGVWVDGSSEKIDFIQEALGNTIFPKLLVVESMVNRDNAGALALDARGYLGIESVDFFSLDIDGNDLHVCEPFLATLNPKLVCVEYNAKFPPPTTLVMDYNPSHAWRGNDYFGASLQAWVNFFQSRGYVLVCCNASGANAFFVKNDLATDFSRYPIEILYQPARYQLTGLPNGHKASLSWIRQIFDRETNVSHDAKTGIETSLKQQLVAKTAYGHMLVYASDEVIGKSLRVSGSFQEQKIAEVAEFFKEEFAFLPDLFVDIGANIGTHSIFALKKEICSKAIVFEPDIDNFYLLQRNIAINRQTRNVESFRMALSNSDSDLEMELSGFNYGDHRIRPSGPSSVSFGEEYERKTLRIPATTLDKFAEEHHQDWTSSFVWMDTQGHEGFIFEGGRQFLAGEHGPRFVVAEFWPYGIERSGGKERYLDFIASCAKVYDINHPHWRTSGVVTTTDLLRMYRDMLASTEKEHHPHTDLLLVLNGK